jgi:serpin B
VLRDKPKRMRSHMKSAPITFLLGALLAVLVIPCTPGGPIGTVRAQAAATHRAVPPEPSGIPSAPSGHPDLDSRARRAAVAIRLYRELARRSGNVFVSPYSLEMALAMAQAGARGSTARAFAEVLGSDPAGSPAQPGGKGLTFTVANALWAQSGFPLIPGYVTTIQRKFGGSAQSLDFSGEPRVSAGIINHWVSAKTHGRIDSLVSASELEHRTSLMLTDAVYFKGAWVKSFNPGNTHKENFHLPGGRLVRTEMMHKTAHLYFYRGKTFKMLMLPFRGGHDDVEMLVLLPDHINQFSSLEQKLEPSALDGWVGNAERKLVEVTLPKFRNTDMLHLTAAVKALGLAVAFSKHQADFAGIARLVSRRLYVSKVLQRTYVDLDEKGTEAAATTAVIMQVTATASYHQPIEQPIVFDANHRFVYLIRDDTTGDILFIGRMANPHG